MKNTTNKEQEIKKIHWDRLKQVYRCSETLMLDIERFEPLLGKEDLKMILENLKDIL